MLRLILGWLSGGVLDRVFETVDKQIEAKTDREALKTNILMEHMRTRPDFMKAGGFWLMLLFAAPLAIWWGAVILYSILWCARCAYPQPWTIAALPAPLDQWAGLIVMSIFGVIGLTQFRR